jgi:hypothetical protein
MTSKQSYHHPHTQLTHYQTPGVMYNPFIAKIQVTQRSIAG